MPILVIIPRNATLTGEKTTFLVSVSSGRSLNKFDSAKEKSA